MKGMSAEPSDMGLFWVFMRSLDLSWRVGVGGMKERKHLSQTVQTLSHNACKNDCEDCFKSLLSLASKEDTKHWNHKFLACQLLDATLKLSEAL